ncbi:MAG: L-threonylcarbamoyladenylate synthase [Isosphaeraceae bacterium]
MTPTQVLPVDPRSPDSATIDVAARVLRAGGLVAFPTETVYGLGGDATSDAAIRAIFEAKGRPQTNPLIVHLAETSQACELASHWPESATRLAERFWPGPLTIVLPKRPGLAEAVSAGRATVGLRVPDHDVALAMLRAVGLPIAAPSANRSTRVSPTCGHHVRDELAGRIDLILDAGPTPVGIESTVVDLTGERPRLLRPGAVTSDQLAAALGEEIAIVEVAASGQHALSSPGQMAVHYAPRTPLILVDVRELEEELAVSDLMRIGLIVPQPGRGEGDLRAPIRVEWQSPEEAARGLYATLRDWDDEDLDRIVVVMPPPTEAWRAVRDRLWRASRRWARPEG